MIVMRYSGSSSSSKERQIYHLWDAQNDEMWKEWNKEDENDLVAMHVLFAHLNALVALAIALLL